jgi:hypothetical protein
VAALLSDQVLGVIGLREPKTIETARIVAYSDTRLFAEGSELISRGLLRSDNSDSMIANVEDAP